MKKLNILWTTGNKDTFSYMISMYGVNSLLKGWWDEVNVIIWGASAKLAASDTDVQKRMMEMMEHGVKFEACKACSDELCVSEDLEKLGIEVRYVGESLTNYLNSEDKLLSI